MVTLIMSLHNQIENHIAAVAQPMIDSGMAIISPAVVADEVDRRIDPGGLAPEAKTYASRMHIRNEVRRFLARNFDPIRRMRTVFSEEQADLFSDVLQDYYPVKRNVEGEERLLYAKRDHLSLSDANRLAERMHKAGESLMRHADALVAYVAGRSE